MIRQLVFGFLDHYKIATASAQELWLQSKVHSTGQPYSEFQKITSGTKKWKYLYLGINSILTQIIGPLKNRNRTMYEKANTVARKAIKTKIRHAPPISAINLLKLAGGWASASASSSA